MRLISLLLSRAVFFVASALICAAALRPSAQEVHVERDGRTEFTPDMFCMRDVTIRMERHLQGGQVEVPKKPTGN